MPTGLNFSYFEKNISNPEKYELAKKGSFNDPVIQAPITIMNIMGERPLLLVLRAAAVVNKLASMAIPPSLFSESKKQNKALHSVKNDHTTTAA